MVVTVILLFFLLGPILVQGCSCPFFPDGPNRTETLEKATRNNADVYSGVVVGASCTCISGERKLDCRNYTYSERDGSYSVEILTRVTVEVDPSLEYYLRGCTRAESDLDVGDSLVRGPDPTMVLNGTNRLLVCSFSGSYEVCQYSIRVTEVFIGGTYNVGDLVTNRGPDTASSCAAELGRILQLKEEYMVGVGGPCDVFQEWTPLSQYTAEDLRYLRRLGGKIDGDGGNNIMTQTGGGKNDTTVESGSIINKSLSLAIATVTLLGITIAA